MELRHIHICQRERNPVILRVDLALGKQDNHLLSPISGSCQITTEISKPVYRKRDTPASFMNLDYGRQQRSGQ